MNSTWAASCEAKSKRKLSNILYKTISHLLA